MTAPFHSCVCLLHNRHVCFLFFYIVLISLLYNLCSPAHKVWIVCDRSVCERATDSVAGQEISLCVCVCLGGVRVTQSPSGRGGHAGCHSTGQRAPPAAPMISPA